ncbi:MAG: nucleotidyl transferase AbiEii/AbiGii toxin family protein [Opitutales bacterium]|nr:nucleotidyl transferase AbiEii/AbiGii toxin family protein [Opitutales bacterium]
MEKRYVELVRLLIDAVPSVCEGSPFALKGGTAINLFVAGMPRLSVDLDLVLIDHRVSRNEALRSMAGALSVARDRLLRAGIEADLVASKSGEESKLFIRRDRNLVKVEANHVFRGTVLPVEQREMVPVARSLFATGLTVTTLAVPELYGSKLVAALDRQHPRDLFDVHGLFEGNGLTPEVVDCFVCYLAGHNRPVHEVLFSRPLDIAAVFENEFAGMARQQVALDELLAVGERLHAELPAALSPEHRRFLFSLVEAEPDWNAAPCPHLAEMPAIRWKLENLRKLKETDPRKFRQQLGELKKAFGV